MKEQDRLVREQDRHLKVKGFPYSGLPQFKGTSSEAKRKKLIGAAITAFSVGNPWAFARRSLNGVKGLPLNEQDSLVKEQDRHLKVKGCHVSRNSL